MLPGLLACLPIKGSAVGVAGRRPAQGFSSAKALHCGNSASVDALSDAICLMSICLSYPASSAIPATPQARPDAGKHNLAGAVGHADSRRFAFITYIHRDAVTLERVKGQVNPQLACHGCRCSAQRHHLLISLNLALRRFDGDNYARFHLNLLNWRIQQKLHAALAQERY